MKILRYIRATRFFCGMLGTATPSQPQRESQTTYHPISEKSSRLQACGGALACAALVMLWSSPARATLAAYQTAVTNTASLISYYTFELNDAADVYGTNSGTLMGSTAFAAGVAGAGKALLLDGTGRVNLGVVPDFVFADTTGSAEAWVQAGNLGGVNATIFANQDGAATGWAIHMNGDKSGIGMWNGGAYYPTINIPNPSTNWHHLVAVFDSGNWTVYWDGTLAGTYVRPLGFTDPIVATQIGSTSSTGNAEGWVGMLDEVAFYADALTPETVLAHYQAFFAGAPPVITKQPLGGTYLPGVARTLSVKATGSGLAYQWYLGTTALTGKTDTTLSFPSLGTGDIGTYSVIVTNVGGSVTSAPAMIALSSSLPGALVRYQTAISNETSLISYYTFDRLTPTDVFGPNNGTLAGTADWSQGIGGGPGQGLLLDGSGHVQLGSVPNFDFTSGSGTVEGWVRADWASASGYPCMFADRDGPTVWSMHLSADKTTLTFYNGITSAGYHVPGGGAGTNWHHVALVFDAGNGTYYWDGALVGTQAVPLGTGPATVQLGSSAAASTSEGWIGMLDEVAFYSTALPATSIQAHYNAYFLGNPPVITGQPVGGYFLAGQTFQTSVAASGAQLTYQWYKDNIPISGATNAFIGSASLTPANSGAYYVKVSNGAGSTNSVTAILQVGNNITRYQATVLGESSLLSYYTFDAGDGRDAKNAHPGTAAGTVAFGAGTGGVTNQSLTLDGTGHFDLGYVPDFEFTNGIGTAEGWIQANWTAPAGYDPTIFADRNGGSDWSIHMDRWKNAIGNWNNDRFQEMSIPGANGWHHYAIVFNTGHVSMYWDGQPLGTFAQPIDIFTGLTTQIGSAAPTTTDSGWMGGLDEVAFYSAPLGADTIWNHFLAMVGPGSSPTLRYSVVGDQLTLSWPADVVGFTLEYADSLPASSWTAVDGVVNNQVSVDVSSGMRFFRLRK